ncbi:hypothetical protein [Cysteiniphilum marinum]|nr:hypothetical protein [Cysteiniphilum marinum]
MRITQAITVLENLKATHGDVELYNDTMPMREDLTGESANAIRKVSLISWLLVEEQLFKKEIRQLNRENINLQNEVDDLKRIIDELEEIPS